jgi:hypothetical protein
VNYAVCPEVEYRNDLGRFNRTCVETLDEIQTLLEKHRGGIINPLTGEFVPEEGYARLMLADVMALIEGRI